MANLKGTPIWFELTTDDPEGARDFYAALAGWSAAPSPVAEHGGYLLANAPDGEGVAGIMKPQPGMEGMPGWALYLASDDVDADAGRVREWGGTVEVEPMDIPHVGRFAVVSDPQGVPFMLMKGAGSEDSTAFKMVPGEASHGHGVWIELATPDPDGAFEFYGKLFGWKKHGAMPMGDMGEYAFFGASEAFRPGAMMSSEATGAHPGWNWYVHVPDIDAAIAIAREKGGSLLQGPDQIPGGDFSANLRDAGGAQIGIVGPRKQ